MARNIPFTIQMDIEENKDFLHSDQAFVPWLSWMLLGVGFLGGISNLLYILYPTRLLYFFQVSIWGNTDSREAALSNLNICLALIVLGFSLSLRSRMGWLIGQILLTLLTLLFLVLSVLFFSTFFSLKPTTSSESIDTSPIIEAILTNLCFFSLSLMLWLYLCLPNVRKIMKSEK
ncbi:MAG: hypothetical protein ACKVTZ_13450 [Bacteroidia bacterium]